eukprot:442304-Amphidinium_carterae.1
MSCMATLEQSSRKSSWPKQGMAYKTVLAKSVEVQSLYLQMQFPCANSCNLTVRNQAKRWSKTMRYHFRIKRTTTSRYVKEYITFVGNNVTCNILIFVVPNAEANDKK